MINFVKRHCVFCGIEFQATRAWHKYCSHKCQEKKRRKDAGLVSDNGRFCKQCGGHFVPDTPQRQHCSVECAKVSAKQSRASFLKKNPNIYEKYYQRSREKNGKDGNLVRLYKRYPELPKCCESCGESRVLDIAHRPEHKRNGAWRNLQNTTPEKIWILCPTCHALLDRKGYEPKQLNLK
jgi:hypothetical protein